MKRSGFLKSNTTLKKGTGFKKKKSSFNRKISEVSIVDSKFSKKIINRDKRCLNCGSTSMLTCSHYHGRSIYSTRFDEVNCITLCVTCHEIWESKKGGVYKDFMISLCGYEEFCNLEDRSKLRVSKEKAIEKALKIINVEQDNEIQY